MTTGNHEPFKFLPTQTIFPSQIKINLTRTFLSIKLKLNNRDETKVSG